MQCLLMVIVFLYHIPESAEQGRYLKLLLPDSNNEPSTSVAEIYVYGK